MRLRVIGVGSALGDDAVGLAVARRLLAQDLAADVEVVLRERPGLDLLDDLRSADAAVLVDALRGSGEPGRVLALLPRDVARGARLSSHQLGVGAALALGDALGAPRPPIRIIGIEIGSAPGAPLCRESEAVLVEACAGVHRALADLRAELAGMECPPTSTG